MSTTPSPFDRLTAGRELPRELRAKQGSDEITGWCPRCRERAVPMRNGTCGFCGTPVDLAKSNGSASALPPVSPSPASKSVVIPTAVIAETAKTTTETAKTPAVIPGPSLNELAAIANAAHARVHLAGRELIKHAICIGDALIEARARVPKGEWITWLTKNVEADNTTCYRYMRIAEHREQVLRSEVVSIEGATQLLADLPRRGQGPRRYSDADKRDWIALADEIGIKPAARALGVSPSTIHAWTSRNSPARGQTRKSREITEDRIERVAAWLIERFGGFNYPERPSKEVYVDAARLLAVVFEIEPDDDFPAGESRETGPSVSEDGSASGRHPSSGSRADARREERP